VSLKFDIRGFDEIKKALDKKVEAVTKGVDAEMDRTVFDINAKQVSYTPVDTGLLSSRNNFDVSKPLNMTLTNDAEYAGYVEFGTGGYVFWGEWWVEGSIETTAATWKGKGIRKVNLYPRPFFYRAFFEEVPKMLMRIKKVIAE